MTNDCYDRKISQGVIDIQADLGQDRVEDILSGLDIEVLSFVGPMDIHILMKTTMKFRSLTEYLHPDC